MSDDAQDPAFIDQQRERLEALRQEILQRKGNARDEAEALQSADQEVPGDVADDASFLAQREIEESLQDQEQRRLWEVERALEKIAEGSYGLSDESGEAIARRRLEVKPEALYTVEEEDIREYRSRDEHPPRR
jgi:DnaK suppressor protein